MILTRTARLKQRYNKPHGLLSMSKQDKHHNFIFTNPVQRTGGIFKFKRNARPYLRIWTQHQQYNKVI